jgi:hypothetical protein
MTVVVVHLVFTAQPTWPDASWLLNWMHEMEMHGF